MKAKRVYEFERSDNIKKSLNIGEHRQLKPGDKIKFSKDLYINDQKIQKDLVYTFSEWDGYMHDFKLSHPTKLIGLSKKDIPELLKYFIHV